MALDLSLCALQKMVIIRYCVVEHLLLSKGIAHNDEDLHHAETVVAKDLLSPHILKVVFDLAIGMFLVFFIDDGPIEDRVLRLEPRVDAAGD